MLQQLTHLDEIQAKSVKGRESELAYARVGVCCTNICETEIEARGREAYADGYDFVNDVCCIWCSGEMTLINRN